MNTYDYGLQAFRTENLVKELNKILQIDGNILSEEINEYIWPRLDFLKGKSGSSRYFLIEESYVETEWKDMISVHYINTSYLFSNTVMRVHIFMRKEVSNEAYMGFFTLRKIDEVRIMLSFIYPNWERIAYQRKHLYVMTYLKKVHIQGIELIMHTYPLFVQDNLTIACAQADIISMTKYLHYKFDTNALRINDFIAALSKKKTKLFPTNGMTLSEIMEVFNDCHIQIQYLMIDGERQRYMEMYRAYVDYSIESGIPVLVGGAIEDKEGRLNKHVIQIIGHTKQDRKKYVIYDDSGYFIEAVYNTKGFVKVTNWEKLYKAFEKETSFLIYPIHEKVYLLYDDIKEMFTARYNTFTELNMLMKNKLAFFNSTRYLLVDNRAIKKFLREKLFDKDTLEIEKIQIKELLKRNMSHYIWYCEVPLSTGGYLIFLADTVFSKMSTKDIFFVDALYSNTQLSLLSYS